MGGTQLRRRAADICRQAHDSRRDGVGANPGSYGWNDGYGATFIADTTADLVAILLTQRLMRGPDDTAINDDFLTLAYAAIDD